MSLVKCKSCQSDMSKNAAVCPRCSFPAKWNIGHCRSCKAVLPISRHRYRAFYAGTAVVVNGSTANSGGGSFIRHSPCTQCGEPRPLLKFRDTVLGKLFFFAVGIAIVVSMLLGYYAVKAKGANFFVHWTLTSLHIPITRTTELAVMLAALLVLAIIMVAFIAYAIVLETTRRNRGKVLP